MADLLTFIRECAASGALIGSMCGALVVPFFAWLAIRVLAPHVRRMNDDAGWQAPLAAIAATAPAAIFLMLGIIGLAGSVSAGCLNYLWGRAMFATIATLLLLALCRASLGAYRRFRDVRRLMRASRPPDAALRAIAERCRVRVRTLRYAEPFCALAGLWSPVVLISSQSLGRLSVEELEAALLHERAHAARLDHALGAALSFFAELLPLPAGDLIETYAKAREAAADERATRECEPDALASAIVRLASAKPLPRGIAALTEDSRSIKYRIAALLEDRAGRVTPPARRIVTVTSLTAIVVTSIAPAVLFSLNFIACTGKVM